jgi:hypothetical protein
VSILLTDQNKCDFLYGSCHWALRLSYSVYIVVIHLDYNMTDKKSDNSRPSSAQGALLLMPASEEDTTIPATTLLVPYAQPDTSALFPGRIF